LDDRAAEDRQVVDAVLRGEREAFGQLVARYQRMIAGVAWRYGVRAEEIEDVVSEIAIKSFRGLGQYRPDRPFATWLWRLAVNHLLDRARRARREGSRSELSETLADPAPGPAEALAAREREAAVRGALERISPRYREAIHLVYIEGLSISDTATILGAPVGTIKTRLMRGREALRRLLVQMERPKGAGDALS
jgi:RNA polymerase sigma-70 factor (ECF subfamily)